MAIRTIKGLRRKCCIIFESTWMHVLIVSLILLSLVGMGLETSPVIMDKYGLLINKLNTFIVIIFAIELLIRLFGHGADFFKNPWNTFDFTIIALAIFTFGGFFQLFRAVRLLWFMRLITIFPHFRHLVGAIIRSLPGLVAVLLLLCITIYVFGVIGTFEFGSTTPELFADLKLSLSSMSRAMLMPPRWPHMLLSLEKNHPDAWMFVIPALIILNYLLLHLVLGIIISAVNQQYQHDKEHLKLGILSKLKLGNINAYEHKEISSETQIILHHLKELTSHVTSSRKPNSHKKVE